MAEHRDEGEGRPDGPAEPGAREPEPPPRIRRRGTRGSGSGGPPEEATRAEPAPRGFGGGEPFLDRRALIILGIGALAGLLTRLACAAS